MNIPKITSIAIALKVYYSHTEIGNKEIAELFGKLSAATVSKLKKMVMTEMIKQSVMSYRMYKINTTLAYIVWGIDVDDLEKRHKKLIELGLDE